MREIGFAVRYTFRVATKFPHPYGGRPVFYTQHEAASLIADYQARGHIKRCAHLRVGATANWYTEIPKYLPECEKKSFEERDELFYGCPKGCLLYKPAWKGRVKKLSRGAWWPLRRGIVGTAQWYASLSPAAQAILALGLLALLSAPWRDTVLQGLRIIFGK